jgi:cysteine dioxygenase
MSKCMETMETDSCGNSEMDAYHNTDTIIPPKNLDELIQELHKVFASDKVNIDYVKTLMTLYKSNPNEWEQFANFDPHRYGNNEQDQTGEGRGVWYLTPLLNNISVISWRSVL